MIGLAYVGQIFSLVPIPDADNILSATVVCGKGGKWTGVVRKDDFEVGSQCYVYLPDAIIPENDKMAFMKHTKWRVCMRRFRGAPSEVVIMPIEDAIGDLELGKDVTEWLGVTKYQKVIPVHMAGLIKGNKPSFIPYTDESHIQSNPDILEQLKGKPYYITTKMDGTSTSVYHYKGEFGVCSRNLELKEDEKNIYWKMATKYNLREKLPEGYAVQFETCGPGIQKNRAGLKECEGFAFNVIDLEKQEFLPFFDFLKFVDALGMKTVEIEMFSNHFDIPTLDVQDFGKGTYSNGKQREGVVIRSQDLVGKGLLSFKVINLDYDN